MVEGEDVAKGEGEAALVKGCVDAPLKHGADEDMLQAVLPEPTAEGARGFAVAETSASCPVIQDAVVVGDNKARLQVLEQPAVRIDNELSVDLGGLREVCFKAAFKEANGVALRLRGAHPRGDSGLAWKG